MNNMRKLLNLMEGVSAVPGIGQQLDEKSTSEKQARFMAAAAHDPAFAKKTGMDTSVAKEFNKADTGTKQLSNAMKHKIKEESKTKPLDPATQERLAKEVADRKWKNHREDDKRSNPTKTVHEGAYTQHYLDANKPSKVRQDAEIAKAEKERKDAKEAEKAKKKVNESYTGDEGTDTIIDEILSSASDNYMTKEDALVKVSKYLLNMGYSNDEVLDIMDSVEEQLHDDSMRDDMDGEPEGSYDMSDDADALASAGHGSDEDYYPDTDGMDSPTDFDEYEMNADDSFDEGTSIDDLFDDDEDDDDEYEGDRDCHTCDGTGEGMYDGQSCRTCGGSGIEPRQPADDDFNEPDNFDYEDRGMKYFEGVSRDTDYGAQDDAWNKDKSRSSDDDYEYEQDKQRKLDDEDDKLEETDLNNGYNSVKKASGSDYFPNGAESSVTKNVGPSGAKQGDNPEQKKMQVAEVHKELVYGYRNYLRESSQEFANTLQSLEKMTEKILKRNGKGYGW